MKRTDAVVASSRYIRTVVAMSVAALLPVILGFQLFTSHLGQSSRDILDAGRCGDGCVASSRVLAMVADLESRGMTCRTKPALTDDVIFEWRNQDVRVVDFGAALTASSGGEGWMRQYCVQSS